MTFWGLLCSLVKLQDFSGTSVTGRHPDECLLMFIFNLLAYGYTEVEERALTLPMYANRK